VPGWSCRRRRAGAPSSPRIACPGSYPVALCRRIREVGCIDRNLLEARHRSGLVARPEMAHRRHRERASLCCACLHWLVHTGSPNVCEITPSTNASMLGQFGISGPIRDDQSLARVVGIDVVVRWHQQMPGVFRQMSNASATPPPEPVGQNSLITPVPFALFIPDTPRNTRPSGRLLPRSASVPRGDSCHW